MPLWSAKNLVEWDWEDAEDCPLPVCRFLADLPVHYPPDTPAPEGMAETDPWFVLGNYGLTLFPHVSGSYQVVTGHRGFARLNHDGSQHVTGRACRSRIEIDGESIDLLTTAAREKLFGCGFAQWRWTLPDLGLEIVRRLDLPPSEGPGELVPGYRLSVRVRNISQTSRTFTLTEGLGARYHFANWHNPPRGRQAARYPVEWKVDEEQATARAFFRAQEVRPLVFDEPKRLAVADGFPPDLCLTAFGGAAEVFAEPIDEEAVWLLARADFLLKPGEAQELVLGIGWSDGQEVDDSRNWDFTRDFLENAPEEFRRQWQERLPDFPDEPDPALRAELRWHAHVLHAMATWDDRYESTFIPQGTIYEYGLGVAACTRDHAMHALPACHYDPDLAASVLFFLCRHTDLRGRIQHTDEGAGLVPLGSDEKSDNQLFALLLLAEYLETTRDTFLLFSETTVYPPGSAHSQFVIETVIDWVRYLRDVVGTGPNGLVRILNSDLSDTLHAAFGDKSYHQTFNGESYVNTTMALNVLRRLADVLELHREELNSDKRVVDLINACQQFEQRLREALFADLEDRPWAPRGRVGDEILGAEDDDAFAAPQAFLLSNPDLPRERREAIWQAVKPRLWEDEPFGVRLREGTGKHRCGMVWFAWTGLFAWNLASIDPQAAREGLERLSLRRRAEIAPDQWVGLWSHSDVTWSYPQSPEGQIPGTTRVGYVKAFPQPCAHVHAWPLALYYKLRT